MKQIIDVIVRPPAPSIAQTPSSLLGIPDYARAVFQHQELCSELIKAGINVVSLKTNSALTQGSLIDDMAVITETIAVLAQPGRGNPRMAEQQDIANLMAQERILKFISPPGTLSARDVVRIGDCFYIGITSKTNEEGAAQLAFFLKEFGYEAITLALQDKNIHLKSGVSVLPDGKILIRADLAKHYAFLGFDQIIVPADELLAVSAIALGGIYFMPCGFKETPRLLQAAGIVIREINISELEKTGAGIARLVLPMPRVSREKSAIVLPFKEKTQAAA